MKGKKKALLAGATYPYVPTRELQLEVFLQTLGSAKI